MIATSIDPLNRDTGFMLSVAVRYCLDRHSYAPSLCCDWLRSHWRLLSDHTRALITRDIREHIASEHRRAEIRTERPNLAPPGWEYDLSTWERMAEWIAAYPAPNPHTPASGALKIEEAEKPADERPWPGGCIKPGSCARHRQCMYGLKDDSCRHRGRDIREEVAWAEAEKR